MYYQALRMGGSKGRLLLSVLFALNCSVFAQGAVDYVPDEIIVRFEDPTSLSVARAAINSSDMEVEYCVVPEMDIFKVEIISSSLDEMTAVSRLEANPLIKYASLNYLMEPDLTPNDACFSNWPWYQYHFDYEDDHDIDAPEAWEIATGGRNLFGQDIVIAVIDNGFRTDHRDLVGNRWYNLGEDANNDGIIDESDRNGVNDDGLSWEGGPDLIDDLYGWDANHDDGTIENNGEVSVGHGTNVAGVLGAVTNNLWDVAGVNWNVKIMYLAMYSFDIETAMKCYQYIKTLKQAWYDSDGEIGSNTVAVNMSFSRIGPDCMTSLQLYRDFNELMNDLGENFGILTVTSCPNGHNFDAEARRGVPYTCQSNYILTVTGVLQNELFRTSAFGETTIDMGSYGDQIGTVSHDYGPGTIYAYAAPTGSSVAAPQVAGTAALLHYLPNPALTNYLQWATENSVANPGVENVGVLLLKSLIMDNGIELDVLEETISGKNLNLANTVQAASNFFWQDPSVDMVADSWEAMSPSSSANYDIQYPYEFATFVDQGQACYAWRIQSTQPWNVYRLDSDLVPGTEPSLCAGRDPSSGNVYCHIVWLGGPDGMILLQHGMGGTPVNHTWRQAKLDAKAIVLEEGATVTSPVILANSPSIPIPDNSYYPHPVILLGTSGGTDPGVYFWTPPYHYHYLLGPSEPYTWYDSETWSHGRIPDSEDQNIVSIAGYQNDGDEMDVDGTIYVTWANSDGEIYYQSATEGESGLEWEEGESILVFSDLEDVINPNVVICYSEPLEGTFIAWEDESPTSPWRRIGVAKGWDRGEGLEFQPQDIHYTESAEISLRNPNLVAFYYNPGAIEPMYPEVVLTFDFAIPQIPPLSLPLTAAIGLIIEGDYSQNGDDWTWSTPCIVGFGRGASAAKGSYGSGFGVLIPSSYTGLSSWSLESRHGEFHGGAISIGPRRSTLDITEDVELSTPIGFTDIVRIKNGAKLTLRRDIRSTSGDITMFNGAEIVVESGGVLNLHGYAGGNISIESNNPMMKWSGITVDGGQLTMDYVEMRDAESYAVVTKNPRSNSIVPVSISNCTFDGNGLMLTGSPKYTQAVSNSVIENVPDGQWGLYLSNCYVSINGTRVQNCSEKNTYIGKVSGTFSNCVFEGRTTKYGVLLNKETCNPTFTCCQFIDLAPTSGLYPTSFYSGTGCNPVFGKNGSPYSANVFSDASAYLLTFQGAKGPLPVIEKRPNDFIQKDSKNGKYMRWVDYPVPASKFVAECQYWSLALNPKYFSPANMNYWDCSNPAGSPYGACGGHITSIDPGPLAGGRDVGTLDEDSVIVDTLSYAIGLEQEEMFAEAQALYLYVIENAVDPMTIWTAASRVVTTGVHLEDEGAWIPGLLNGLIDELDSTYEAVLHGKRILANYYLNNEEYETAINICADLLGSGLTFDDSIFVATDLIGIQMAAGLIEWDEGGLDATYADAIPQGLRVESMEQGVAREQELLSLLGTQGIAEPRTSEALPTEFALYQNYPNPFNPTTQIRYDVPEAVRVQINVYNTLGQLVTELRDDVQAAGRYAIFWDGKSSNGLDVATGMYIFQIKAGSFVEAKKMLLLK